MNLLRTFTCDMTNTTVNIVTVGAKDRNTYQEFAVATAEDVFKGATDMQERTDIFVAWLAEQTDEIKLHFRLNWVMGHSIFNCACNFFEGEDIQNINWYQIYKGEMPRWSHQK